MKARLFPFLALPILALSPAWAQVPASTPDPARITEFEQRFAQGRALEKEGKLIEARAIFDGIIADSPQAKGSLREAGLISLQLQELTKASDYFEKLHALVPDYPDALELLIQVNQSLKRDVKVERYLSEFQTLHESGKLPEFSKSLLFKRERIPLGKQQLIVSQFFNFRSEPNTVWMAELFESNGQLQRRILLNYDPEATQALRARDAKYATTEVFIWFEHRIKDGRVTAIDAYLQIFALPDYPKFRSAMLTLLASPPKPIYTQAVNSSAGP